MLLPWILLFLPLVTAAFTQLLLRRQAVVPCAITASAAGTFIISLLLLGKEYNTAFNWATIRDFSLSIGGTIKF